MSTAKRVKTPPLEMRITATIMAIREELMQYFKGTCIDRQTQNTGLQRRSTESMRYPYQYQRIDAEQRNPQLLTLGRVPICQLEKLPDKVVLYSAMLDKSPGLKEVDRGIRYFLDKYLSGVQLKTNPENYPMEIDDDQLFTAEVAEDMADYPPDFTEGYITMRPGQVVWNTASINELHEMYYSRSDSINIYNPF